MSRTDRLIAWRGFAALMAAALLFALLAVACDGDGGGAGETPTAGETPAADGDGEDGGDGDGDGEDGDGDGAGGEDLQQLESLAGEASEGVIAKVTYQVMTETAGETTEGEWVIVQRPPDSRFEIAGEEGGQEYRTIIITTGGKSYLCTSTGGEESCLATENTEAQTAPFDPIFSIPEEFAQGAEDVDVVDTSQRSIAGVDATCFTVSSAVTGMGEGEVCFSEGGLLLLLRGESEGDSFTFEATSVSTDVTDDDFVPPYDVIDLSDLEDLGDLDIPDQ